MPGGTYEIVVFQAKRSPVESNYQLTLSSFSTLRTECAALCGDGTVAGGEECDLGAGKNTGAYDGCNADCTYAGFCGDGIVNGPEQCDDGLNLSMTYDPNHPGACHPGCTLTPG
jgi:cysteine-rich repeat protein